MEPGDRSNGSDDREKLSRIFDASKPGLGAWRSDELGAILMAQLEAPLLDDLAGFGGGNRDQIAALSASVSPTIRTFHDLLHHPAPPADLLTMVKNFAKACRLDPEGPLNAEVATVLYYAAIVVALNRCGKRITEMNDAGLAAGVAWVVGRAWVDEETKTLVSLGTRP